MLTLEATLKKKISDSRRLAVLGVGSELRGDDGAGLLVAEYLRKITSSYLRQKKVKFFFGSTAPENLTGEIRKYNPTHLLIIDSAEIGEKPGVVRLIEPYEIGGVSFCSHQLPLQIMADYLVQAIGCSVLIIGIQPARIAFNQPPSREIISAARRIAVIIKKALKAASSSSLKK